MPAVPELQSQLHRAARNVLGDARVPMKFADTAKLGLFEGVAFEAMRMRTVAPLIFLEANETTELSGIEIPAGTAVFVLTRPASLDDNNYRDAKAFTLYGRNCSRRPARRHPLVTQGRSSIRAAQQFGLNRRTSVRERIDSSVEWVKSIGATGD